MSILTTALNYNSPSPAIIIPETDLQISYNSLKRHVQSLQSRLASLGVSPHSAVTISLINGLEFAISFLAIGAQRAIAAPLNPAYQQREVEFYIDDIKATLLIVPQGAVEKDSPAVTAARKFGAGIAEIFWDGKQIQLDLKEKGEFLKPKQTIVTAEADDIALVLHTSGTTGRPKAVPLTHRNLTRTMKNIVNTYKLTTSDRSYLVMPLFHVHGLLAGFLAPLHSGGTVIIPPKFSATAFWPEFQTYNATWYTAVPTIHQILLRHPLPSPQPTIRFIRSCSSALAEPTFHTLEKTFNAPVLEAYAMTEAAHQMTSNPLPPAKRKPGSVGPGQGVEVAILDSKGDHVERGEEGEICVRGENVTRGYLNNEKANRESFTKDGWFRTGDQGKLDGDGYVIITGRIKELINRGGEKIAPVEVDGILLSHKSVVEAVCFAVPDRMYGQEIHAAVVIKQGEPVKEKELQEYVATKAAKFKIPKKIYFTKEIPKTATGKVQRAKVSEAFFKPGNTKAKL